MLDSDPSYPFPTPAPRSPHPVLPPQDPARPGRLARSQPPGRAPTDSEIRIELGQPKPCHGCESAGAILRPRPTRRCAPAMATAPPASPTEPPPGRDGRGRSLRPAHGRPRARRRLSFRRDRRPRGPRGDLLGPRLAREQSRRSAQVTPSLLFRRPGVRAVRVRLAAPPPSLQSPP